MLKVVFEHPDLFFSYGLVVSKVVGSCEDVGLITFLSRIKCSNNDFFVQNVS